MLDVERARFRVPPEPSAWQRLNPHPVDLGDLEAYLAEPETLARLARCDDEERYPREVLDGLRERGLMALLAQPNIYELGALNALTARRDTSVAITCGVNALSLLPTYIGATPEQRKEILGRVAQGAFSSILLTEAAHGSNLLRIETLAEPGILEGGEFRPLVGEGTGEAAPTHYRLTGEKHLINGAHEHTLLMTLARTRPRDPDANPLKARADLSMFCVERDETVTPLHRWRTHPARAADISGARFEGTIVPASRRLGEEGGGFPLVRRTLSVSRGGIASLAAGTATQARELASAYAARRDVYGEPILQLGAIAEHLIRAEALERVVAAIALKAVAAVNSNGLAASRTTAVAKLVGCALAEETVLEGAHVLGGRALLAELPYARLLRDVRLYGVFDGTRHVMLAELESRLADEVYRWAQGKAAADSLEAARRVYATPPRDLVEALAGNPRPETLPLPEHLAALAALPGDDLSALPRVAEALYGLVFAARKAGRWDDDQAVRFAACDGFALLEALAALIELADPSRRAALCLPPLSAPEGEAPFVRFASEWLGARVLSQVRELAAGLGLDDWEPEGVRAAGGVEGVLKGLLADHARTRLAARTLVRERAFRFQAP